MSVSLMRNSSAQSAKVQTSHAGVDIPGTIKNRGPWPLTWFCLPVEAVYWGVAATRATVTWSHR